MEGLCWVLGSRVLVVAHRRFCGIERKIFRANVGLSCCCVCGFMLRRSRSRITTKTSFIVICFGDDRAVIDRAKNRYRLIRLGTRK